MAMPEDGKLKLIEELSELAQVSSRLIQGLAKLVVDEQLTQLDPDYEIHRDWSGNLIEEIGDVLCMVDIVVKHMGLDTDAISERFSYKNGMFAEWQAREDDLIPDSVQEAWGLRRQKMDKELAEAQYENKIKFEDPIQLAREIAKEGLKKSGGESWFETEDFLPNLEYKGYVGDAETDMSTGRSHGTIQGIRDMVTFQSDSINKLEQAFRDSVDDYIEFCKESQSEEGGGN